MEEEMPPPPPLRGYLPLLLPSAVTPWTQTWSVVYRWRDASPTLGVVAVVLVDVMKLAPESDTGELAENDKKTFYARIVRLRDAMEMHNINFQLFPPQLRSALMIKSPALVEELDQRGACLDVVGLEFELQVAGTDTRWLSDIVAQMLASRPQGSRFEELWDEFLEYTITYKMTAHPIYITVDARLQEVPGTITDWHVERFFSDLAIFAAYSTAVHVGGISQADAATFVLKRIHVSVSSIPITPWVVQRVHELVKIQPHLIVFDTLTLDPRMIACDSDDVQRLVQTVADSSPHMLVTTGSLSPRNDVLEVDEIDHAPLDRLSNLLHSVFGAIGCAKSVKGIDLSLLMLLLQKRQYRKVVWKALAGCLSTSSATGTVQELVIDAQVVFDNEDAKLIRGGRQHSGKGRRIVKSMAIEVAQCSELWVLEFVSLAAGLESLLLSRRHGTFSSSLMLKILKRAPHLHTLELDRVKFDCVATVNELARATRWQSLSMVDAEFPDVSVIFTFLHQLGDPTCPLARSLRVLRLSSRTNTTAVCTETVLALATTLQTNHVLQDLHLTVQRDVSQAAVTALRSHHGDCVRHPQPRQQAAFLSALKRVQSRHPLRRIDNHAVEIIFSFSTIYLRRQVNVRFAPL